MKTAYDADVAFLYPNTGKTGTPLFYALMLHDRMPFWRGQGFIPNPGKTAFYRVTNPQPKE